MASSLACFYGRIPVFHVEAGLRSQLTEPWPEEFNRQLISLIADYHFAPTANAKLNLVRVGVPENKIDVTGNTAIDSLFILGLIHKMIVANKHAKDLFPFFH